MGVTQRTTIFMGIVPQQEGDANMDMKKATEILNENGIKAELSTVSKAGKEVECIRFGEGRVTPSVYQGTWDQFETEEEVLDFAQKALDNAPQIEPEDFFNKDYIMDNIISCIRHETNDDKTLKFPVYGDLEEYFRIPVSLNGKLTGSVVILNEHVDRFDIDVEELRSAARDNLRKHAVIQPMQEVLAQMMGDTAEDLPELGETFMSVGTVKSKSHGASVMLLDGLLRQFCAEKGIESVTIIPSSVHEVILIPDNHEDSVINNMIDEVNTTQITDETEVLSSHLYRFVA